MASNVAPTPGPRRPPPPRVAPVRLDVMPIDGSSASPAAPRCRKDAMPVRVLIVDDSAFMRRAISRVLGADADIRVVGQAANGEEGVAKVKELRPDVVVLDLEMPVLDG